MTIKRFERLTGIGANSTGIKVKFTNSCLDMDPSVLKFENSNEYEKFISTVSSSPKLVRVMGLLNDLISDAKLNPEIREVFETKIGNNYTLISEILTFNRKNKFAVWDDIAKIGKFKYEQVIHERLMRYLADKPVRTRCQTCIYSQPGKTEWLECTMCATELTATEIAALPFLFDEDTIPLTLNTNGKLFSTFCISSFNNCEHRRTKRSLAHTLYEINKIL